MVINIVANIVAIFMAIVTISSIITAVTPTPQEGWKKKLYKVLDVCALNVWKAKDKWGDQNNGWKNFTERGRFRKEFIIIIFFIEKHFGYVLHMYYGIYLMLLVGFNVCKFQK